MAIPVEKPPAPYEPARGAPLSAGPSPREPSSADPAVQPSGSPTPASPNPRVRVYRAQIGWQGCLVALGLAFLLVGALGGLGSSIVGDVLLVEAPTNLANMLRNEARARGREPEFDLDLRHFEAIVTSRRLSIPSSTVLHQRFVDCKMDGQLTDAELESMMAVVHDVVVGDGEIDPASYPNMR